MTPPPSKIYQKNIFQKAIDNTLKKGYYEAAHKELAPVPYAERNRFLYLFCRYFTVAFHVLSGLTAFFGVLVIAKITGGFDNENIPKWLLWTLFSFTTILLAMVLIWAEILKHNLSVTVFKAVAIGENVKTVNVGGLIFITVLNIIVSAFGGAAISYQTSDKTTQINKVFNIKRDSLLSLNKSNIALYDNTISYYENLRKSRQKRSKMWGLEKNETALLDKAISEKSKLLSLNESKINTLENKHKTSILDNENNENRNGLISAGIMLLLELLALWFQYFRYQYYKYCEIENANFNILNAENTDTINVQPINVTVTQDNKALLEIAETIKNLYVQPQIKEENKSIGFPIPMINKTEPPPQKTNFVAGKGYFITCPVCGLQVWKKRETAVYCSDKCRLHHHKEK